MKLLNDRISAYEAVTLCVMAVLAMAPFCCWRRPAGDESERLTLWAAIGTDDATVFRKIILDFEKTHPDVRVKFGVFTHRSFDEKLLASMQAGTAPDVFYIHYSRIAEYAAKSVLEPLDEYIRRESYDLKDFFPASIEAYKFKGTMYGMPIQGSTMALFYNKDLFDAAGEEYPDDTWTREKFLEVAKKLTHIRDGVRYIGCAPYDVASWLWSGGGSYGTDDLSQLHFTEPKTIAALQFYVDLCIKHRVTPKSIDWLGKDPSRTNVFENGKIGMAVSGPWSLRKYMNQCRFSWDVALFPTGPEGRQTRYAGMGYSMWAGGNHKKLAWELLKHLCNAQSSSMLTEAGLDVPVRRSVAYSKAFLKPGKWEKLNMRAFLQAQEPEYAKVRFEPRAPAWQYIRREMFGREMDLALQGHQSVKESMEKVTKQARKYLNDRSK